MEAGLEDRLRLETSGRKGPISMLKNKIKYPGITRGGREEEELERRTKIQRKTEAVKVNRWQSRDATLCREQRPDDTKLVAREEMRD